MKTIRFATALLAVVSAHRLGSNGPYSRDGESREAHTCTIDGGAPLFPFLTKLRDSAVELLFGRHPTKDAARSTTSIDSLRNKYANEIVMRFNVTNMEEEKALAEASNRLFLDVWGVSRDYVDIRMPTNQVSPLLGLLPEKLQSSHFTLISDLSRAVYDSLPKDLASHPLGAKGTFGRSPSRLTVDDSLFFLRYHPLKTIMQWMQLLESIFPEHVKYMSIGQSSEGRDIPALRVGRPGTDAGDGPRKTMVITAGLHAREWISTTTANYVAWALITEFNKDPVITKFLHHFDVVIIPVLNPDGMEYSWQSDRLWRKSRQETSLRMCKGYDLDRSFGFGDSSEHRQSDPCSEDYGGEEPFDAAEALAFSRWAHEETEKNNVKFVGMIDYHSYSQQILFPYAYSCSVEPPNLENLEELAAGIAKTIRVSSGESYSVSPACDAALMTERAKPNIPRSRINEGAGSVMDWFYHDMNAHFSYQIKLRDHGLYGFLLPDEEIIPTGREMFYVMKYVADYLLGNNGIEMVDETPENDNMMNQELRRRYMRR
ncbi:zinc carboxypeptidase [Cordyceps fumosorosea ARSEF 2679]|uniref:Inactive metallocarboxypeptidase ECM14 n=1 Tax=Cordyceps fumosorosea (strain ARSEF 2679) TaxID=1081104 RepID=A0A167YD96_CORFA|nr:zinc carboxypeptidase [Cordyceps fumosorosea ARSEF 2679]OAA66198.1 zinc carboxypeptidase [Cordyceps fumosorosea ARSEF 2679]